MRGWSARALSNSPCYTSATLPTPDGFLGSPCMQGGQASRCKVAKRLSLGKFTSADPAVTLDSIVHLAPSPGHAYTSRYAPGKSEKPVSLSMQDQACKPLTRLEGLVWIRLGFSSDFPQELGLYA